jgi:phosphoglycolate phosphatase
MIKLLMFDLDGTLFETARGIHKAINQLMAERKEPPLSFELVSTFIGYGLRRLIDELDQATQHRLGDLHQLELDFRRLYTGLFLQESTLYPGVTEFLKSWPHELAVVSNKDEFYVRELITRTELNQFNWSSLIGGNTYPTKKPDPEPLLSAIKNAKTTNENALMIGDGLPDIEGAKRAKVRSIAVTFGYTPISELIQAGADGTLEHYQELSKLIQYFC